MDDFWAPIPCKIPVIIGIREVRWCHLARGHTEDQHETIYHCRAYSWPANERSTTP